MATFTEVPVLEVNLDNFRQVWPTLEAAIKSATYVAIDAELSGLGERKKLFAKDMDLRYSGMRDTAQTRSIISLGLSCFQLQPVTQPQLPAPQPVGKSLPFLVQTFNILVLCSENYTVEPMSLKFLLDHGFDFNRQYAKGLPYYRGADKADDKEHQSLRQLFTHLVRCSIPVVLHNAPVDLVFLYHSFYGNLPANMSTFLADLSEVLVGGVYDTKYIAEYKARFSASYLEYVFRRCQRENQQTCDSGLPHTRVLFPPYPRSAPHILWLPCGLDDRPVQGQEGKEWPCRDFAAHGWCAKKNACPFSHDIDTILNKEDQVRATKRKRKRKRGKAKAGEEETASAGETSMEVTDTATEGDEEKEEDEKEDISREEEIKKAIEASEQDPSKEDTEKMPKSRTGGHRAGYDAFMTGFAFAYFVAKYGKYSDIASGERLIGLGLEEFMNKVALSGKDIPLQIAKSGFAKNSKEHRDKIENIRRPSRTDIEMQK